MAPRLPPAARRRLARRQAQADAPATNATAASSDLTAGTLLMYIFAVIAAGFVLGIVFHYVFSILIPGLRRRFTRWRARRHLRRMLNHSDKFPTFHFDPNTLQRERDLEAAAAAAASVDAEQIDTPVPGASIRTASSVAEGVRAHEADEVELVPMSRGVSPVGGAAAPHFEISEVPTHGMLVAAAAESEVKGEVHLAMDDMASEQLQPGPSTTTGVHATTRTTCTVCLDDYAPGDKIRELPCGHDFHDKCVRPWLEHALADASGRQPVSCPVCRREWSLTELAASSETHPRRRSLSIHRLHHHHRRHHHHHGLTRSHTVHITHGGGSHHNRHESHGGRARSLERANQEHSHSSAGRPDGSRRPRTRAMTFGGLVAPVTTLTLTRTPAE